MSTAPTAPTGPNPYPYTGAIEGIVYAFDASGGYVMEAGFSTIVTLPQSELPSYDVTNALQITIPASVFNAKLDLESYDEETQTFTPSLTFVDDSISLTAEEFQEALASSAQIVSTGAYTAMYANFKTYVTTYFGVPGGFASLFNQATLFDLTGTDEDNLYDLFKPAAELIAAAETVEGDENVGNYTTALTGTITIGNITQLLRYAVDTNVFGNRDPAGTGADDPNNVGNFGVADGFQDGDLIYVKEGTQITLDVDISPELFTTPFNNPNATEASTFAGIGGTNTVAGLTTSQDSAITTMVVTGDYSSVSTVTRTNIKRVLKAPLLIRLTADAA
jgi:hypothetical protein